jgi:hypothetical protein
MNSLKDLKDLRVGDWVRAVGPHWSPPYVGRIGRVEGVLRSTISDISDLVEIRFEGFGTTFAVSDPSYLEMVGHGETSPPNTFPTFDVKIFGNYAEAYEKAASIARRTMREWPYNHALVGDRVDADTMRFSFQRSEDHNA